MKKLSGGILILLFLTAAFVNAQTRGEKFEKKYGKPISENKNTEEFYVHKDIILKITYDNKNLPEEFSIFPVNESDVIGENLSDEIKEEIIPTKERIGKPAHLSFYSGCNGVGIETYRNVKIKTYPSCEGVVKIEIKFGKFPEGVKIIFEEDL